jgi:hypothetical protein
MDKSSVTFTNFIHRNDLQLNMEAKQCIITGNRFFMFMRDITSKLPLLIFHRFHSLFLTFCAFLYDIFSDVTYLYIVPKYVCCCLDWFLKYVNFDHTCHLDHRFLLLFFLLQFLVLFFVSMLSILSSICFLVIPWMSGVLCVGFLCIQNVISVSIHVYCEP